MLKPNLKLDHDGYVIYDLVLLSDEPTSALDPELVQDVLNIMKSLANEDRTMVVITYEIKFALDVADVVIVIDDGEVVEQGSQQQQFSNPQHERTKRLLHQIRMDS